MPYSDTPEPKVYGHASPLDPQLFSTIAEHAGDLLAGRANGKYSPAEVAVWLDGFVAASEKALAEARKAAGANVDFRRLDEDCAHRQRAWAASMPPSCAPRLLYEVWLATHDRQGRARRAGPL